MIVINKEIFEIKLKLKNSYNLGIYEYEKKLLALSDLYICIYENNNQKNESIILEFWACFPSLINIEYLLTENVLKFLWRQRDLKVFILFISTINRSLTKWR